MKDDFDFNTYSKYKISEEKIKKISHESAKYNSKCIDGVWKILAALSTEEEKIKWLRKALMNALAVHEITYSFLKNNVYIFLEMGNCFTDEFKNLILEDMQRDIMHAKIHLASSYTLLNFILEAKNKDKETNEEIQKLQEMMEKE